MKRTAAGLLAGLIVLATGCQEADTEYHHRSTEEDGGISDITEDVPEQDKTEHSETTEGSSDEKPEDVIELSPDWDPFSTTAVSAETDPTEGYLAIPQDNVPDWSALQEVNPDTRGWITVPGTNIDSVVVQGEDNEYYYHHDFYGNDNEGGSIFADFKCDFRSDEMPDNTILYGSGKLYRYAFSALSSYVKDIDFLKKTPMVDFRTQYKKNKYKIISVFITNIQEEHGEVFDYTNYAYFRNSDEFYSYILEVMDRSMYNTGVDVQYGDELLTLSTDDASAGIDDMRLVIVARKVREGEQPEVDTSNITRKDSVKYCEAYTEAYGSKWKGRTWDISLVQGMKEYLEENGLMDEPENY